KFISVFSAFFPSPRKSDFRFQISTFCFSHVNSTLHRQNPARAQPHRLRPHPDQRHQNRFLPFRQRNKTARSFPPLPQPIPTPSQWQTHETMTLDIKGIAEKLNKL